MSVLEFFAAGIRLRSSNSMDSCLPSRQPHHPEASFPLSPLCFASWPNFPTKFPSLRRPLQLSRASKSILSAQDDSLAGRIFGPADGPHWWDEKCLFHPIVVREPDSSGWRMYYYGRGGDSWHSGVSPALISSGRIGMALSEDGINWRRVQGSLSKGAVMDPREVSPSAFDCVHVGCSDVFFYNGQWWMYYFGGGLESVPMGSHGRTAVGMKLRTGLAKSSDGVHDFEQLEEAILDVGGKGEWDEAMAAWARVIPPCAQGARPWSVAATCKATPWLMTYSALEMIGRGFSIGVAISEEGVRWTKLGKALERGAPGSWDDGGVGRRHVVPLNGQYFMFYEGANKDGIHGIGLAISKDGIRWHKDKQGHGGELGGPIFTSRRRESSAWDSGGVAAPHVVELNENSYGLYYVGFDVTKKVSAIGLAFSDGMNIRSWKRVDPSLLDSSQFVYARAK